MKPDISIFGSACRPELWMRLYESIGENKVPFEVIFAGPNEPDYELPGNFKFIKTNVKPAQCWEIAARQTTAALIMNIADDVIFMEEHPLDKLYEAYVGCDNPKLILSCRYMVNGVDASRTFHKFYFKDMASPTMPMTGLISRKLYMGLGGIDRNFVATLWDFDIAMSIYSLGSGVILSGVYLNELRTRRGICQEFWGNDRKLLDSLWPNVGKDVLPVRTRHIESFTDERILEESQGPKGRWV